MNKKLRNYSALALGVAAVLPTSCKKDENKNSESIADRTINKTISISGINGQMDDSIDVNLDGIFDFNIHIDKGSYYGDTYSAFYGEGLKNGNDMLVEAINIPGEGEYSFLKALGSGTTISASSTIWGNYGYGAYKTTGSSTFDLGNIKAGSGDKYIGFRFKANTGSIHYGWALVNFASDARSLTIKELAYHKDANTAINAGDK